MKMQYFTKQSHSCSSIILLIKGLWNISPMVGREKRFRISCGHGRQSKNHDQEKPTSLLKGLGHGELCKGDSNQGVSVFYIKK